MRTCHLVNLLFIFSLLWITGCGGCNSGEEQGAVAETSSPEKNDRSQEEAPASLQEALAQVQEQVQDAVNELNSGEKVPTTDHRELRKLLPERLLGLSRVEIESEMVGALGFNTSVAKALYKDGEKEIEVSIVDVGGVSFALEAAAAWSTMEIDRETEHEIERTFTKNDSKYFEKYNFKTQEGETSLITNNRFVSSLSFENLKRADMEKALDRLSLEKKLSMLQ